MPTAAPSPATPTDSVARDAARAGVSGSFVALACGAPAPKCVLVALTTGRTLWIAWPNDTARPVADKPYLLVPRNDELWWVGTVARCSIDREGGGWVDGPIVCRGGQEDEEGGEILPRSFTGEPPLPLERSEIVRQLPNVGDASASPTGGYLLAQRADSMMLFRVSDGRLGTPLLRIHVGYGEELVMIRWATPDEARQWSATLLSLAPPRIHVFADSATSSP